MPSPGSTPRRSRPRWPSPCNSSITWRREELQRAYLESIAHLPEAQAPSPEARELVLELLEEISRMLEGLKPKVRTAFLLAQCEDLSHRQIAERMGVSQRSVERYVAEALYHCYLLRYGE